MASAPEVIGYGCEPEDLQRLRRLLAVLDQPYQLTYAQKASAVMELGLIVDRIQGCPLTEQATSLADEDSQPVACPRLTH